MRDQNSLSVKDLQYCVSSAMADIDASDTTMERRMMKFAIDGYKLLVDKGMIDEMVTKTATLPVDHLNIAYLPRDFRSIIHLGICVNGRIVNLTKDTHMCPKDSSKDECGDLKEMIKDAKSGGDVAYDAQIKWPYSFYWQNGQFVGGMYGYGPARNDGYYLNLAENRVELDMDLEVEELILQYKATNIGSDGNALIPDDVVPFIVSYIHMQRTRFGMEKQKYAPQALINRTLLHQQDMKMHYKGIKKRRNPLSTELVMRALRSSYHQGIKR